MLNKLLKSGIIALFAVALFLPQTLAAQIAEAPVKKITEMLYPSVLVDLGEGTGSGTIIFSDKRTHESWKAEKTWTLVLTNYHVIQTAINIEEVFDPKSGKNIQKETRRPVHVRLWDYNDYSTAVGTTGRVARIVAWDKDRDLALLRLDDTERVIKNIAKSIPVDHILLVKEHPASFVRSWRSIEEYKELMSIPGVKLIHPDANTKELINSKSFSIEEISN